MGIDSIVNIGFFKESCSNFLDLAFRFQTPRCKFLVHALLFIKFTPTNLQV
jgi:hypothetical protein